MNFFVSQVIARNEAIARTGATNLSLEAIERTRATNFSLEAIALTGVTYLRIITNTNFEQASRIAS
jgi:hypothetical protein